MSRSSAPQQVRLGIAGVGAIGKHHARTILSGAVPGCVLAAVCDIDPSKLEAFPGIPAFGSSDEMIQSGLIDAILISTPHYSHTTIGISALGAGLHVLVEKPVSVHKADAKKLIAAHKSKRQVFAVMFNQRTDPRFLKIRSMVQSGELGTIRRIQWTVTDWFRSRAYYESSDWRATWAGEGGGVLLNQCAHNIDLFQWIFGMPRRVRAVCQIGLHHEIEVEDDVTAIFEYDNKTTAVLVTSSGEAPGLNRLEISGERGLLTLEKDQFTFLRNEVETSAHSRSTNEGYLTPNVWKVEIPITGRGEQHAGILRNFTNAILKGEALIAPAREGIHSVELINAMLLSSFRDKTVKIPVSPTEYQTLLQKLISQSSAEKRVVPYSGSTANYLNS